MLMFSGFHSNTLRKIEERLTRIESDLAEIKSSTKNMDTHIGFVESVFQTVKAPFEYVLRLYYREDAEEQLQKLDTVIMKKKAIKND